MSTYSKEAIERFEDVLKKDPESQVFAPLADAYRTQHRLLEAERIAAEGTRRHPNFPGGWLAYGRLLKDLKKNALAISALEKASQLSPENILALTLLGDAYIEERQAKKALQVFKKLLLINPKSEKAQKIVTKLESLTADEYDDETFAMTKLSPLPKPEIGRPQANQRQDISAPLVSAGLQRMLSLIDAFIVRNDLIKAAHLIDESAQEFGEQVELAQRRHLLRKRRSHSLAQPQETAQTIEPIPSREEQIRRRKIERLQTMLRAIEDLREQQISR